MSWVLAGVGLGALIFIHELGHFVVSLVLGMRPRKFYVGFPPPLVKVTRGGIEYGLGAIPLGGFVKIPGMHRPVEDDATRAFERAVEERPSLQGPVARLQVALAADDHDAARIALTELAAELPTRTLSPQAASAAERGLDSLGDALGPDAYWRAATWKRVAAIFAGPAANIVTALVLFTLLFATVAGRGTAVVDAVQPGSPAAQVGLQAGDRLLSIDGVSVDEDGARIAELIAAGEGRPVVVVIDRTGSRLTLPPVAPQRSDGVLRLGFTRETTGLPFFDAAWESVRVTGLVAADIGKTVGRLVTGDGRDDISSPVGIVRASSDAAEQGADSYLWVLGLISLSLAFLNLLPLLPFDGGHIVFAVAEGIRGRSVRRAVYEKVSIVGFAVVLLLFFIGLSNDVGGSRN
ncbi:MAG: M50 family metallopeptidase [Gaiella sp.]